MNLYVEATAVVDGVKVSNDFDLWQTSTKLTYEAVGSDDPRAVYEQWVREVGDGQAHLTELAEFLDFYKDKPSFKIDWYYL
jgi:hypothetical protein